MRFCSSAILASLTSSGACTKGAAGMALAAVCGFLPPVSHIIRTISKARLMSSQDWTFFGSRPGGLGAFSCNSFGWFMGGSLLRRTLPRKRQFLFADGEIAAVEDLGDDVNAVFELEIEQVIELELGCVTGAETVDLLARLDLRGVELVRRLRAQSFQFFLVCFRLA